MDTTKLIRISSITKKLLVGLFGSFLLVFLLFHMTANLFILAKDGGDAYSAFCHFMGSNIFIKVFEIALFACFVLHAALSVWLWFCNKRNRPVGYHKPSRTKTAKGSKLAIISGSLLLVCLFFHFYDFYFVKTKMVKSTYMVKIEDLYKGENGNELYTLEQQLQMYQKSPEDVLETFNEAIASGEKIDADQQHIFDLLNAMSIIGKATTDNRLSKDMKWLRQISSEERGTIEKAINNVEFEPDFYNIAHQKFSIWHIVLCYLIFFIVVGFHIRHGFESAFQTFGLNHYKYSRIVEVLGIIYCWIICLGFAIVPIGVFLGL